MTRKQPLHKSEEIIKLKQRKDCFSCSAFNDTLDETSSCALGYNTRFVVGHPYGYLIPLESCPKPMTMKEYLRLEESLK